MADFSEDINEIEKIAKSVANKERSVTDAQEIADFHQARAHLHQTYLVLNKISKKEK